MITQRPQDVNKKALYQAEVVFAFQLTGPLEIDAVKYWTKEKGFTDDLGAILPKLEVGHAHLWSPVLLKANREVHIAKRQTFPAGQTPKVGAAPVRARDLQPIEIEALKKQMAATIELAKADDPKALRQRIAELEAAAKRPVKPEMDAAKLDGLLQRNAQLLASEKKLEADVVELKKVIEQARVALSIVLPAGGRLLRPALDPTFSQPVQPPPVKAALGPPEPVRYRRDTKGGGEDRKLQKGEIIVLSAIAQHTEGVSRGQLTVLTGYKRSSRDTYLQRLAARGLTVENGDGIQATPEGKEALGDRFEPLPTGAALREHHLRKLPAGEREVLRIVLDRYPDSLARDEISEATGYKRSSRDTYLQRLNSRKLVSFPRTGMVRASDGLF
jgi:Mn-dependent DtxR family transcriptional regulator